MSDASDVQAALYELKNQPMLIINPLSGSQMQDSDKPPRVSIEINSEIKLHELYPSHYEEEIKVGKLSRKLSES